MSDVKWISITTDIFDNRKIKQLESMPEGDAILVIWIKLLCLAGKVNEDGSLLLAKEVPYTDQLLATEFNKPLTTVQMALALFEQYGMIEIVDDIYCVSNWEKYQKIESLSRIRESGKKRQQKYRERKKLNSEGEEVPMLPAPKTTSHPDIVAKWNALERFGIAPIKFITSGSKREGSLVARLRQYGEESFDEIITQIENSDFLKGIHSGKPWQIDFDWMIRPENYPKVLEGKYLHNKEKQSNQGITDEQYEAWLNE